MTQLFIPETKNPPAKVRDAGVIKLVMGGSGVYNAKTGDVILLPAGVLNMERLSRGITSALFEQLGFQRVDCSDSEEAVFSLAERYVREYNDGALSWMGIYGRELVFHGWSKSKEEACIRVSSVLRVIETLVRGYLPSYAFVEEVRPKMEFTYRGLCETDKGSLHSTAGLKCSACGTLLLADAAAGSPESPVNGGAPMEELSDIHTPGAHTIPLLCGQLGINSKETLKAMLYTAETANGAKELLFAMIRGDKNISIQKLSSYIESKFPGSCFRRAEADEIIAAFGDVAGYCGPVVVPESVHMVADTSVKDGRNFVVGANRPDYHRTGCCWGRDFEPNVADLLLYEESGACPKCGGELKEAHLRGICSLECCDPAAAGGGILSCRDREGQHLWPYRWSGRLSLESLLLAVCENGNIEII